MSNLYEPDNPLQLMYDDLFLRRNCLCTLRESCSSCDGSLTNPHKLVLEQAAQLNYDLYGRDRTVSLNELNRRYEEQKRVQELEREAELAHFESRYAPFDRVTALEQPDRVCIVYDEVKPWPVTILWSDAEVVFGKIEYYLPRYRTWSSVDGTDFNDHTKPSLFISKKSLPNRTIPPPIQRAEAMVEEDMQNLLRPTNVKEENDSDQ